MAWRRNPQAEAAIAAILELSNRDAETKLLDRLHIEEACPRCRSVNYYRLARGQRRRCQECRQEYTPISLTPFTGNKLTPQIYLGAIVGLLATPPMSTRRFAEIVGIQQRSAWRLRCIVEDAFAVSDVGKNQSDNAQASGQTQTSCASRSADG